MKNLLMLLMCSFVLCGCGSFGTNYNKRDSQLKKIPDSIGVQILEKNKKDLTTIKNKTADDIELGFEARKLNRRKCSDTEFGRAIRNIISEQQIKNGESPCIDKKTTEIDLDAIDDINARLNMLIVILSILNLIELTILIISVIQRWRHEDEELDIKRNRHGGNKDVNYRFDTSVLSHENSEKH